MKIYQLILFSLVMSFTMYSQENSKLTLPSVKAMTNDTAKVLAWLQLSEGALEESFDKGKEYADEALKLAQALEYANGINLANEKLGRAYSYLGDYKMAFRYYKEAYERYKSEGNKRQQANMLNRMGESKRQSDEYEDALEFMQESLKISLDRGDTNEVGSSYISIGILYAVRGKNQDAEAYFLKAIESFKAIDNKPRQYLTMLNMAGMYNDMGELEKSIDFSLQARDYFKEHGTEFRLGVTYFNLGVAYSLQNKLEESKKQFLNGLEIFEKLGDKLRINGTILRLAEIDLKLGNISLALKNAELAIANFEEMQAMSQLSFSYNLISNIYKEKKDFEKALEYRVLNQDLNDSINSVETNNKIAELEEKYQSEIKDKQLAEANASLELNELILQKQQNQKYAFMGLAAFVLIILVLLYNQYRIKMRNNDTLRDKNEIIKKQLAEKEVLIKEIHHRVKNNLQFISSLLNLQARHITDPQTLAVLTEGKNRVLSMALVHQKLYQEENLKGVQMRDYVQNLVDSLVHSLKIDRKFIDVKVDVETVYLDIDTAMPVGMILNELITNAFKYAFNEGSSGEIKISLKQSGEEFILSVCDNGKGFSENFKMDELESFGFKLVQSLAEKLKAKVQAQNKNGASITLRFPNQQKA